MYSAGGSGGKGSHNPNNAPHGPSGAGGAGGPSKGPVRFRVQKERKGNVGQMAANSVEEKAKLASFQSISYLPLHTKLYKEYLKSAFKNGLDWQYWVMNAIVGVGCGLAGALLKNLIQFLTEARFHRSQELMNKDQVGLVWLYTTFIAVLFAFGAAAIVVYFEPIASGSGVPEVMAYLNGVSIPKFFAFRTLVAKYLSVGLAVASGLCGGNEGPMIAIGASVGKLLSQGTQLQNGCTTALFKRFRNMYDRRNFISAGAAAGVASAFGAPVGGLLFVLEEISSFWSHHLAWMIFFCCMISTITTELITNSFEAFRFTGQFGLFTDKSYAFFVDIAMRSQIYMFGPVVLLGILGGVAGAGFTLLNIRLMKFRARWIARIRWRRLAEVVAVAFVTATLALCLPLAFPCLPLDCAENPGLAGCTERLARSGVAPAEMLARFTCPEGHYNAAASLLFTSADKTIAALLKRETHYMFDYASVICLLLVYSLLACYTAGMAQASGIMVPSLLIGSALGRLFGLVVTDISGGVHQGADFDWIDPGVFALIGAAAFFGGLTRLTMSLVVIMIELTNETHFLLPLMTAVMVARWTADAISDSLYHCLIQLKCLPFLPDEPHTKECLELHSVREVMSAPAVTLPLFGPVADIARALTESRHSAFPVVEPGAHGGGDVFKGMILRNHVICILAREDLFVDPPTGMTPQQQQRHAPALNSPGVGRQFSLQITEQNRDKYSSVLDQGVIANLDDKLPKVQLSEVDSGDREALVARLTAPAFEMQWVNLSPYIDMSSVSVPETFSLERGYHLFRTMGLRHICVVDKRNAPIGILSRKDLLPQNIEQKLEAQRAPPAVSRDASSAEALDQSGNNNATNARAPINAGNRNSSNHPVLR